MTLNELLVTFVNSDRTDWNRTACWGHGSGPSYRNQFTFYNIYNGAENVTLHKEHSDVASFKNDLSITIAWGLDIGDEDTVTDRDWAKNNPDPSPGQPNYLDFFYNNALVFRTTYTVVDGGRCELPFPTYSEDDALTVPRMYHDVIKKLADIRNTADFDGYFERTGIEIVDSDWIE